MDTDPADVDERRLEMEQGTRGAGETARLLARHKALAVSTRHSGRLIVGADQTLALEGERFTKPEDRAQAREQLTRLRGKTHTLHSAVSVVCDGSERFSSLDAANLTMRNFSDAFLERYLDSALVTTSVGGYQLEALGIQLFESVHGDHFTILGLPLLPLLGYLRQDGYVAS